MVYVRGASLRITGLRGTRTVPVHLLAGAAAGVVLYLITETAGVFRWYGLVATSLAGLGMYFGFLYLVREFTREDFDLFWDTANPKKMLAYIRDEIRGN
jgi:hypothetical protein